LRTTVNVQKQWLKGWIQTFVTHTRDPMRLVREMGWIRSAQFYALLAGGVFSPLLGPIFTVRMTYDAIWGDLLNPVSLGEIATSACALSIFGFGFLSLACPALLGMQRRGLLGLAPWLLLAPVYYGLLFCATWGALLEYFRDPYRWAKTQHGLARTSMRKSASETPGRV
jgi:hypothetical protein